MTVNNDRSRIEENMIRLPIRRRMEHFSVDVSDKLKQLKSPNDFLSLLIVPNTAKPTTMRIKSPRLRAYTEKRDRSEPAESRTGSTRKRLNHDIDVYLKKDPTRAR